MTVQVRSDNEGNPGVCWSMLHRGVGMGIPNSSCYPQVE